MASLLATMVCNLLFSSLILISIALVPISAYQFQIGGPRGWIKPTKNDTEVYDEWAMRNRFHIGDSRYFKYENDSVLVVNRSDYINCNVSNPVSKFRDGNTVFQFDRYGFFYFTSGEPEHCESGPRLVIRVMVHPGVEPPESAPSPSAGGGSGSGGSSGSGGWGPPTPNSTTILSVGSYFMAALVATVIIVYLI